MGGALAFLAAANLPNISAAVPFYGIPAPDFDPDLDGTPIQAHFGKWCI